MSWDQIHLVSRSIMRHKIEMLNMVLEPIAGSFGSQYKGHKLSSGKRRTKGNKHQRNRTFSSKEQRAQKDAAKMNQLRNLGFPIN